MSTKKQREKWARYWLREGKPHEDSLSHIDWMCISPDYLSGFFAERNRLGEKASLIASAMTGYHFSPYHLIGPDVNRYERLRGDILRRLEREHLQRGYKIIVPWLMDCFR